jgi:hypothetical protein
MRREKAGKEETRRRKRQRRQSYRFCWQKKNS